MLSNSLARYLLPSLAAIKLNRAPVNSSLFNHRIATQCRVAQRQLAELNKEPIDAFEVEASVKSAAERIAAVGRH